MLRILLRAIRTTLRHASPGAGPDARIGAVSFLQRRVLRLFQRRGLLDEHTVDDMLTWQGTGGFSVDASVHIHGSDRAGRERLLRYCARPPFALDPLEFLDALSRLIPPPRVHRHRYHGVLAPNARLRGRVVTLGRDDPATADLNEGPPDAPGDETALHRLDRFRTRL